VFSTAFDLRGGGSTLFSCRDVFCTLASGGKLKRSSVDPQPGLPGKGGDSGGLVHREQVAKKVNWGQVNWQKSGLSIYMNVQYS
jgi:hypothetical protein